MPDLGFLGNLGTFIVAFGTLLVDFAKLIHGGI